MTTQNVTLPISGMTCANCAMNIERSVRKLPGVEAAAVNFAAERAEVSYDAASLQVSDLVASVEKAGFKVPTAKVELAVTGMTCANCAMNIERTLGKINGVTEASVNFAAESAAATYAPGRVAPAKIVEKIRSAGFGVPTSKVEFAVTKMSCACCCCCTRPKEREPANCRRASCW